MLMIIGFLEMSDAFKITSCRIRFPNEFFEVIGN